MNNIFVKTGVELPKNSLGFSLSNIYLKNSMKKILFFILLFTYSFAGATVFYISPSGNDFTGNGSINNPWKTLRKATLTVNTAGDTIHVTAGNYLETEVSYLAVGISVEGEGTGSVLKSNYTYQWSTILSLSSPEGTQGNQQISNLKFDGSNMTSFEAISITGRSNIKIHHCTFIDFRVSAVMWAGRVDFVSAPPAIHATGNSFYNNIVTNCAYADAAYGRGAFQFGGQDGMLIYDNDFTEKGRPTGTQGWPIKNCNEGHIKNCKIYSNSIKRDPYPYAQNGDFNYWNFAIELFYEEGLEIYNNVIEGSIDMNHQTKGNSAYSAYIHDNVIGYATPAATWESGIILEFSTTDAIIERNVIKNCMDAIEFSLRNNSTINNIRINNNLAYNIGITDGSLQGYAVRLIANNNLYSSNGGYKILNNTFSGLTGNNSPFFGVQAPAGTGSSDIEIKNNILQNFSYFAIVANPGAAINGIAIQNNNLYNNGSNNGVQILGGTPANYVNSGNITTSPSLNINFQPNTGSPVIDAGIYAGLAFNGSAPDIGYYETGGGNSNIAPTANAGADITVTLPTTTTTLTGAGTDPDGTIVGYLWKKLTGPNGGFLTTSGAASSAVTGLLLGTYQYELTVTDNSGAIGKDTVLITVIPDPNIAPTADAGADQTITHPINTVTLNGSGADADGTITAFLWTKLTGPAAGAITNAASAITDVTALAIGVYTFELRVTDNNGAFGRDTIQITVNPNPLNIAPTANAGAYQTITLPTSTAPLNGAGTDADGTVVSYLWTKLTGPAAGAVTNNTAATTTATALAQGVYTFEFKVTDDDGATGKDTVQITVNPDPNIAPTANAGADQIITLPTNTVTLNGTGNDPDGNITAYLWRKISGPAAGALVNAASATTNATGLIQGIYLFELRVTDNSGAFGRDTVQVLVNTPPTANAGANQVITLPTNTTTLSGFGTDADGNITSHLWTKISGPAGGNLSTPANAVTNVTGLIQGVYQFELTVTDNHGALGRATVQVTVNAANIPPVANAGPDQSITLPVNSITLSGSGTDADGTIASYHWVKIAGPNAGVITNANAAVTTVTALAGGIYQYELTVTDNNGAISKDVMQLIVFVPNVAPTANAGLNQSLTLPTNSTTLSGFGTDTDGTIVAYLWTKISGLAGGNLTSPSNNVTTITGLSAGIYVYELRVTDNSGAFARATVQITVNPENIPPVANAGPDQIITLPDNKVTLNGKGSDVDGTVTGYKWKQISGPADKLTSLYTPTTVVDALIEGSYQFELTVTDNKGATGKDTVGVVVQPLKINTLPNTIKAYPNPVVSTTTLEINRDNAGAAMQVVIIDVQGKIVYQKQITGTAVITRQSLDFSKLLSGTYFISVQFSATEKQTIKIIKQ